MHLFTGIWKFVRLPQLNSIGSRIATSVIVLMVLAVCCVGWFGYVQQRNLSAMLIEQQLKDGYDAVIEDLKARERTALMLAHANANTFGVAEHLDKFDKAWLLNTLNPLFKLARDEQGYTFFNVFKPPGLNMLRWHQPDDPGGDDVTKRRQTVVEVFRTGQSQAGLEPGRDTLAMFAVVPVRLNGQVVGATDVATVVDQKLAEGLKKRLGVDIAFHVYADNQFVTMASTIASKSMLTTEERQSAAKSQLPMRDTQAAGRYFAVTAAPLLNFAGKSIGATEIAVDVTDSVNQSRRSMYVLIGVAVAAIALGLSVSLLLARGIGGPIREITATMRSLAEGNIELAVPHGSRTDEIGTMAATIETFRQGIIEQRNLEAEAASQREQAEQMRLRNEQERETAERQRVKLEQDANDQRRAAEEERRQNIAAQTKAAEEQRAAMEALAGGLSRLAEGDLTFALSEGFTANYAKIRDDFNTTIVRLRETIHALADATREVSSAAAEISTSTTDLSQRTEEQAAGLEETSASMEEISVTVKKNAENAQHANALISETRKVADQSGPVVANAVEAMSRIEDSSQKIADIIGVIDEIARQTNLLALNAAVEAARAGDAGRGFAVVASEVRSLAQRSSQAAKDIKDLIVSSTSQVKDGVELVNQAGQSLNEIASSVKKAVDIVAGIATASAEQATGIDQVNKALTQMDEATQQNSALVEENAATAKTLEVQSAAMNERVSFFRFDNAPAAGRQRRTAA
jgi:methyl-accepting chemotaxis protein